MNPFLSTKSDEEKVKPSQMLGGAMGWHDEIGFETETSSASSVVKGVGGIFEDIFSLGREEIAGVETKPTSEKPPFPITGSIEFSKAQAKAEEDQKQKEVAAQQRIFFQAFKEDQQRAKEAKERMLIEEEIAETIATLPTEAKNDLLHYQASYKNNRSTYQMAELRRKIIEQRKEADKKQKETSMAQTQPKASAMNAAFEGGSGSQGGGQSNLSFQATG